MGKFAKFIVTFVVLLIVGSLALLLLNGVDDNGGGIGGILDGGGSSGSTDSGGGTSTTPGGNSGGVTGCKHTGIGDIKSTYTPLYLVSFPIRVFTATMAVSATTTFLKKPHAISFIP